MEIIIHAKIETSPCCGSPDVCCCGLDANGGESVVTTPTTGLKLSRETTPVAEAGCTRRSERLYQTKGSDSQSECVFATRGLPHARVRDEVAVREIAGGRRGRHYDAAGGQLAAAMLAAAHCSECGIRFKHMHSLRRHFRLQYIEEKGKHDRPTTRTFPAQLRKLFLQRELLPYRAFELDVRRMRLKAIWATRMGAPRSSVDGKRAAPVPDPRLAWCPQCSKKFKHAYNLKRHLRVCHQVCLYPCDYCNASFNRSDNLLKHVREKHRSHDRDSSAVDLLAEAGIHGESLQRLKIERNASSDGQGQGYAHAGDNHERLAREKAAEMRGSISNDADDSLAGETAEGRGRSGNDDRQCTQCGMVFCSAGNLRRHVKARHQAFIFPCDFCGAAFNRSDNLRKHNREKHGLGAKGSFRPVSGYKAAPHPLGLATEGVGLAKKQTCTPANSLARVRHRSAQEGEQEGSVDSHFQAVLQEVGLQEMLPYVFSDLVQTSPAAAGKCRSFDLLDNVGPSSPPHQALMCKVCGAFSRTSFELHSHEWNAHGRAVDIGCRDCDARLATFEKYVQHYHLLHALPAAPSLQRAETLDPPRLSSNSCRKCGASFSRSWCLKRHMWKCEGTFHLACQVCGQVFWRKDTFRSHLLTHTTANPTSTPGGGVEQTKT
ncbi:hypothetical protein C0Q70_08946 [Pomacea canaliculata]|uniref:C2H2-type domain-containing protein n=1 Tax=Pomacea canaliculata TaxID=400727 RepID=A0A2T7P8G0_POMCA|nr:hypothetical protein C0Q70_08946 [Pomacea canaliculata]